MSSNWQPPGNVVAEGERGRKKRGFTIFFFTKKKKLNKANKQTTYKKDWWKSMERESRMRNLAGNSTDSSATNVRKETKTTSYYHHSSSTMSRTSQSDIGKTKTNERIEFARPSRNPMTTNVDIVNDQILSSSIYNRRMDEIQRKKAEDKLIAMGINPFQIKSNLRAAKIEALKTQRNGGNVLNTNNAMKYAHGVQLMTEFLNTGNLAQPQHHATTSSIRAVFDSEKIPKNGRKLFEELKTKRERKQGLNPDTCMFNTVSEFSWDDSDHRQIESDLIDFSSHPHPQLVKAQLKKHATKHDKEKEKDKDNDNDNDQHSKDLKNTKQAQDCLNPSHSLWTQSIQHDDSSSSVQQNTDQTSLSLFDAVFGDDCHSEQHTAVQAKEEGAQLSV
ncbi:hypothetical protein RFI_27028 [Reticulomyxa filosa]|uniref:Uncharacterized protein n=1 Tax=Reticulomyxa filosa TaxID=46433 RepID=X6M8X1_RETFI|nr:hypothetical protein RFI_27028 [Reticulomyxa filosa]|eukprot:ETO10349.1 hypothetical protein RFI_27028 [Reticulomyxa filosa]